MEPTIPPTTEQVSVRKPFPFKKVFFSVVGILLVGILGITLLAPETAPQLLDLDEPHAQFWITHEKTSTPDYYELHVRMLPGANDTILGTKPNQEATVYISHSPVALEPYVGKFVRMSGEWEHATTQCIIDVCKDMQGFVGVNIKTISLDKSIASSTPSTQTACTADAKLCPDGSSVGRVGPKCEFAECSSNVNTADTTVKSQDIFTQIAVWTPNISWTYPQDPPHSMESNSMPSDQAEIAFTDLQSHLKELGWHENFSSLTYQGPYAVAYASPREANGNWTVISMKPVLIGSMSKIVLHAEVTNYR